MRQNQPMRERPAPEQDDRQPIDRGLQAGLWAAWTLAVATTAYLTWHAAAAADHPVSRLALLVHCALAGIVGMIVITWVEMRITDRR
jgi:hypothetical protein